MSENPSFFITYIVPILLGIAGSLPGLITSINNTRKVKVDTIALYEATARNAAQNVITKDNRIDRLETTVDDLRGRVHTLEDERDKLQDRVVILETEKLTLAEKITSLINDRETLALEKEKQAKEITLLKARVLKLEHILRENEIPVPNNGDDSQKGE